MQKSNFLMTNIANNTFDLYIDDYTQEKLKYYRSNYQEINAFFRYFINGQEKIIIFPLTDDFIEQNRLRDGLKDFFALSILKL